MNIVAILVLGAFGGALRFFFETFGVYGTLIVNLIGALTLGFFCAMQATRKVPEWVGDGVGVGLIGFIICHRHAASHDNESICNWCIRVIQYSGRNRIQYCMRTLGNTIVTTARRRKSTRTPRKKSPLSKIDSVQTKDEDKRRFT